ncbi:MAG: DUF5615 family PIN-like protein [Armatimonadota bacterium]
MKLLLDQGLARSAVMLLREDGIDAVHVGDIGASTATDSEILQISRDQQRIAITLDADFHALLALSGSSSPSVIRVRIEGLRSDALVEVIRRTIERCHIDLIEGAMVMVTETKIRVRKLPLIRESA